MADSNAVAGSSSGQPTPASGSRSRIHFSDDQASSEQEIPHRTSRAEGGSPLGIKTTHSPRGTVSSKLGNDGRRRVRSLGAKSMLSDTSPFRPSPAKRSVDIARM